MHELEHFSFMRDLFCLLPSWPAHEELSELVAALLKMATFTGKA
jgi:hypothetical protein